MWPSSRWIEQYIKNKNTFKRAKPRNKFGVSKSTNYNYKNYQKPQHSSNDNDGAITSTINSSKFSQLLESGDQYRENQEENKSLYPDCESVIQGLLTLSFWNRNHNHSVWPVRQLLIECKAFTVIRKRFFKVNSLTDLFENVKIDDVLSFLRETELYQKYDLLKLVNLVQRNEILLIENFTYISIRLEIFGWTCYIYIYI